MSDKDKTRDALLRHLATRLMVLNAAVHGGSHDDDVLAGLLAELSAEEPKHEHQKPATK